MTQRSTEKNAEIHREFCIFGWFKRLKLKSKMLMSRPEYLINTLIFLCSLLFFESCIHSRKPGSPDDEFKDLWKSEDFQKRFPLKNLKLFNADSLYKLVSDSGNLVDSNSGKIVFPSNIQSDSLRGELIDGQFYYCSSQKGNSQYKAFTYLIPGDIFTEIVWVNYNAALKPISTMLMSLSGGDAGVGNNTTSYFINDTILIRSSVVYDGSEEMEGQEYFTHYTDSTVEKFILKPNGIFKTISTKDFHKEQKIKNENNQSQPDPSGNK